MIAHRKLTPIFRKQPLAALPLDRYGAGLMNNSLLGSLGKSFAAIAAAAFFATSAEAAFLSISLPGTSVQDNWTGLTAMNYPTYPTYVTSGNAWSSPIAATSGTGGSSLDKISGLGFPSNGGGIYVGGPTSGTGTFAIGDSISLAGLETVVFQLEIEGVGASWTSVLSGLSLNYNGGAQALAYQYSQVVSAVNTGEMFGQPSTRFTLAFQWDLTAIAGPVNSFNVAWTAAEHSIASNIQMNQGDTMLQAVPEPSTWLLFGLGVAAISLRLMRGPRREEAR